MCLVRGTKRMIPWNRRFGGIGESAIETRLKYFSNPMKTQPEHDEGIDFYCVLEGDSSLSSRLFLIQAKGTHYFDKTWSRSFGKRIVRLWLNQLCPVYIVVYDDVGKQCYWISIEEIRDKLGDFLGSNRKTIRLTINKTKVLELDRNADFVRRINEDSKSLSFRTNLIRGTPQLEGEGYVRKLPILVLPDVLMTNIREGIRTSMNYLIYNYIHRKDMENAYNLCKFLTTFDRGHYDHFVLLGNICNLLGRPEEACLSYRQAIEICKEDKNWNLLKRPTDPSIEDVIASIEKGMKSLDCESICGKSDEVMTTP